VINPTAARAKGPGKLYRETRDGVTAWWLDYSDSEGKRRRKKLSSDRMLAERMRSEIIARRDREASGLGIIGGRERLLSELAEAYLQDLKLRSGPGHLSNKSARLRKVISSLRPQKVGDLSPSDVIALQGALQRAGDGNTTINMKTGALCSMLNWAVRTRLVEENPIRHIKPLPCNERTMRRRQRDLTEDQIGRLIAAAEAEDRTCHFDGTRQIPQATFLRVALETGCRYGELRQLRWGAIDFDAGMLLVRGEHAKSGKSRSIPIRGEICTAFRELQRVQAGHLGRPVEPHDHVFLAPRGGLWLECSNNANRLLYRLLEAADIPRHDEAGRQFSIHGLRHTFCSRLARSNAPLEHARVLMGHSDVRLTSRVYTHLEAEQTRGAIEGLPPTTSTKPAAKLRLAE